MTTERSVPVMWAEERSFIFDCVVRYLQPTISTEDDPLAILVMALLFDRLNERDLYHKALSRVEAMIFNLPEVLDSTMQIRDCLLASGYHYVIKEKRIGTPVDHITLHRINFAASNEWFNDSNLAVMVALIADQVMAGLEAKRYLRRMADGWLKKDFALGILHYCLIADDRDRDEVYRYLIKHDWSEDDITTLAWGLLTLGKLRKSGYSVEHIQYRVAQHIISILGNTEPVQIVCQRRPGPTGYLTNHCLTTLELAFAALALNIHGFDTIVGVHRNQREALNQVIEIQKKVAQGGVIVSRHMLALFRVSFIGFLFLALFEFLRLTGIQALFEAWVSVILSMLLSAVVWLIVKRGLPSTGAAIALFGELTMQDSEKETNGDGG